MKTLQFSSIHDRLSTLNYQPFPMIPIVLPSNADRLTESTSIAVASQIQGIEIFTPLNSQPIVTSYIYQGTGATPIVLLHGFDSSLLEFRRLFPLLAEHHRVYAIDLLGFGFTQRLPDISYSPTTIQTHLYYTWKTLIQEPMILVGASMGGAVALEFSLKYPELVKQIVLIDSVGCTKPPQIGKFINEPLGNLATKFLSRPQVRTSVSNKAYYDRAFVTEDALICASLHLETPHWSKALISFTRSGGYGILLDRLSAIQQPTLIIWGENDRILGTKPAKKFATSLPNSQLHWIPKCGHVPHLETAPVVAELMCQFFC
jgi:pimeloyl-ACP methyl ester carboxylesterase